jgi:hypothetical protein
MSLFQFDMTKAKPESKPKIECSKSNILLMVPDGNRLSNVFDCVGELEQNKLHYFTSRGNWSAHNVLQYVVDQIGECDVLFTSWAISLEPMKAVVQLMAHEKIRNIGCLLSDRVGTECPVAFQFLKQNIENYKLTKIHAKGFVAWNDQWTVSVNMSSNFTENRRIESFMICTQKEVFDLHKKWIIQVMNEATD